MQTHCYRSIAFGFDPDGESNEVRRFVQEDTGLGWLTGAIFSVIGLISIPGKSFIYTKWYRSHCFLIQG
jgi:hypothetical protein